MVLPIALSDLTIAERASVLESIATSLIGHLAEGPMDPEDLVGQVAYETQRFKSDVRVALSRIDVVERADGRIALLQYAR